MIVMEAHMTLTLHLTPDAEAMLVRQAALAGSSPERLALEAIQEKLAFESESLEALAPVARLAEFRAWASAHPASAAAHLDDSRESIYEGRGQ
jgi:hypothetical protein